MIEELIKIQSELKAPKDKRNNFGGYNYRSCEQILESVKPLLKECGCVITITDSMEMIGTRFYVKATATLTDKSGASVSVSAYAREEETKKGMDASQITGSASSYARKYALNGLLCIDDTKDADALNTHGAQQPQAQAHPQANAQISAQLSMAINEINACKSRDEMKVVFNKYKQTLGSEHKFVEALNVKASEVKGNS